ncbi:MAG: hypothetical protein A3I77_04840 [Gammaproteobacteria bacterium RIFCSPLOWO2_02_FULL_42_14]|nr:MAG: hypothetical protein A3B71_06140 [Gammaproteobacteria bacterium RIFCSPHIGHO2_02_FULL_42_43]OGT51562.1 MAG: hypothetical protein A3E54_05905 [Gammaproteobacteria bacterium RIFCSPHIGHO2_12_FULL_41_25]OGT62261.1 MAG: hypothetical protein A3I77_04840 [Gammaproteobacteria bacterium RIFCSPLOWO2_02_FULL_42_14]OGT85935.1 MAG: hypothetical protein A3G86_04530 [Gammaproteobacteria bacterium RIFCSPLOWO2_12_FULL_42_18]
MSTVLEDKLWHYPSLVVTESQLAQLLGGTPDSYNAKIRRAVANGHLIRLKRGVFCLGKKLALKPISTFEMAQFIYGPSYVSFESALSYHSLIPEAVYMTTSACILRNRVFNSLHGNFSYSCLPTKNFFIEVEYVESGENQFLMASPWKALLDYIYHNKLDWHDFSPVLGSLRIEDDALPKISRMRLQNLKSYYHSKRINIFVDAIPEELIV